jgi:hypothetical protein
VFKIVIICDRGLICVAREGWCLQLEVVGAVVVR